MEEVIIHINSQKHGSVIVNLSGVVMSNVIHAVNEQKNILVNNVVYLHLHSCVN